MKTGAQLMADKAHEDNLQELLAQIREERTQELPKMQASIDVLMVLLTLDCVVSV